MSKSRLEKFLYALYSLDSSDLPNPLSRIEELYKCLVTGDETPTFKPLSRVEKYLMTILGVYDADELPNPISRVEVLLYKLATGDDNLDDVKSFLSEHEELLAEIIRNGGVGGNIDIEYILYTLSTEFNALYNTAEKPVKSAILKGNTLVNVNRSNFVVNSDITGDYENAISKFDTDMKASTTYTVIAYSDNQYEYRLSEMRNTTEIALNNVRPLTVGVPTVFTTSEKFTNLRGYLKGDTLNIPQGTEIKILIIEGDHSNENIPYFEGMQSVKMPVLTTTGKNLFNINGEFITIAGTSYSVNGDSLTVTGEWFTSQVVDLKPNTTYTLSYEKGESDSGYKRIAAYINGASKSLGSSNDNRLTFTTPPSFNDIRVIFYAQLGEYINTVTYTNIQLEEGSVATECKPYKSNILTVNEEVELRGIGDVKDELNLLTGELTQRVDEIVLDGSEETIYGHQTTDTKTLRFFISCFGYDVNVNTNVPFLTNSNLPNSHVYDIDEEGIFSSWGGLYIRISKTRLMENSAKGLKNYLQSNPITVQYQLATESVKTVDLSVVDQDGNDTKLSTFDDLTHVTLSSEGLIPEVELEVATKNEEVLSTLSLEMDDISTSQNTLEETANTQSENVDATMIATTEIYEELL